MTGIVNRRICFLHQARQERYVHDAFRNFAKSGDNRVNGEARRDFAIFLASDAIRNGEEPSLRLHLRGRGRKDVAEGVLVVFAAEAAVGQLGKLNVKHSIPLSLEGEDIGAQAMPRRCPDCTPLAWITRLTCATATADSCPRPCPT